MRLLFSVLSVDAKASMSPIDVQMEPRTDVTAQLPPSVLSCLQAHSGNGDREGWAFSARTIHCKHAKEKRKARPSSRVLTDKCSRNVVVAKTIIL